MISITPAILAIFVVVATHWYPGDGTGPIVAVFFAVVSSGVWMVEVLNAVFGTPAERLASEAQQAKDKAE